jgi:hypothetical protein
MFSLHQEDQVKEILGEEDVTVKKHLGRYDGENVVLMTMVINASDKCERFRCYRGALIFST